MAQTVKNQSEMRETWVRSSYSIYYPVFLPGEFHGQRSLEEYRPWDHQESDTTERLTQWMLTCSLRTTGVLWFHLPSPGPTPTSISCRSVWNASPWERRKGFWLRDVAGRKDRAWMEQEGNCSAYFRFSPFNWVWAPISRMEYKKLIRETL